TLNTGREQFSNRRAIVSDSVRRTVQVMGATGSSDVYTGEVTTDNGIAYLFPGGGTQYPGMAAELYSTYRRFQEVFDHCVEILKTKFGTDLKDLVFAQGEEAESAAIRLAAASVGLPAIFITEYAMVQQLSFWGLNPNRMLGHSLGEYTAAC